MAEHSPLSSFLSIFTHNWGIKLLSLILAITIYYVLKPSAEKTSYFLDNDRQETKTTR